MSILVIFFQMSSKQSSLLTITKHILLWVVLIVLLINAPLEWGWTVSKDHNTVLAQIYGAITNAVIFYSTSLYLIPYFFNKDKKRKFWMYAITLVFAVTIIETLIDNFVGEAYNNEVYSVKIKESSTTNGTIDYDIHKEEISLLNFVIEGITYALLVNVFYFVIAFVYRVPIDRRNTLQREQQLIQEKLSAELQFLRAQIHPHTLFNGMNSIYHLIDSQPDKAKDTLLYLSNSLRYHLYDSQEAYVSLDKEIVYLREYIKLYQIRNENEVKCTVDIEEFEDDYKIAPLLFTPFIENAFKYVSRDAEIDKNTIDLALKVNEDKLQFTCTNTVDKFPIPETSQGIGLKNVKKRLDLIYSESHNLVIEKKDMTFSVDLEIKLNI